MKSPHCLLLAAALLLPALTSAQDVISFTVELDSIPMSGGDGFYTLTGQSAFINYRTDGFTFGAQLDNLQSPGGSASYQEVFPAASLADYTNFAYFGRVDSLDNESLGFDTSFVMAFRPGEGVGARVEDYLPYTEAELVLALADFDTEQYLDLLTERLPPLTAAQGAIGLPTLGRPGETLDLVAFTGGPDGDIGVRIGSLSVSAVPEPAVTLTAGLGSLLLLGARPRRRS